MHNSYNTISSDYLLNIEVSAYSGSYSLSSSVGSYSYLDNYGFGRSGVSFNISSNDHNNFLHDKFIPWTHRVFRDSQYAAGTGSRVKIRLGPIKIEGGMHNIQGEKIGSAGSVDFYEEKIGVSGEFLGHDLSVEVVNGTFSPSYKYRNLSFKDYIKIEVGGTIPHPSGAAVNFELHINLGEAFSLGQ